MEKYIPWKYYKDIESISYDKLLNDGYDTLLFDLDNTIINNYVKNVDNRIIELFNRIKSMGFKVFIISNSLPSRVRRISKSLGIKGYGFAFKPNTIRTLNSIYKEKMDLSKCVLIGDQIFTDIKCADRIGIKSILVDPIDVHESFFTIINRGKEGDVINRGDYFE